MSTANPGLSILKLESAKNPKTRRTAYEKYEGRLNCNDSILGEILELRREIAGLLKYTTWADYAAETKMAKSTENVRKVPVFLAVVNASTNM